MGYDGMMVKKSFFKMAFFLDNEIEMAGFIVQKLFTEFVFHFNFLFAKIFFGIYFLLLKFFQFFSFIFSFFCQHFSSFFSSFFCVTIFIGQEIWSLWYSGFSLGRVHF